jgi:putative DNA primase/helicase
VKKSKFAAWIAERFPTPHDAMAAYFDDMHAAAASIGAQLEAIPELDGGSHYLPNLNGKNEKRHYYRASIETDKDGTAWPCVTFGTFKSAGTVYWKPRDLAFQDWKATKDATAPADTSEARRNEYAQRTAALQADADAKRAANETLKQAGQVAAAEAARAVWAAAIPCAGHAYLVAKGVQAFGLRVAAGDHRARLWSEKDGTWQDVLTARRGELLVPMVDADGMLWNVQRINGESGKRFLMGGRTKGTFHRIDGTAPAWLVEGYATGATVRAATGAAVVVAFSANQLKEVAAILPDLHAVAADNDAAGRKGAEDTGLPFHMPPSEADWNDHAARHGLESVAECLSLSAVPMAAPAPASAPQCIDLASLQPVELKGREDQWFSVLAKATDHDTATATAWTIMRRLFPAVPARFDLGTMASLIQANAPACGFQPGFLRAAIERLDRRLFMRRKQAIASVSVTPEAASRHDYQRCAALPQLASDDYQGVILVRAPKASGKTKTILKPFADWASQHGRFVAVVHRVSLVRELARVLGCRMYTDVVKADAWGVAEFATCLPSIVRSAHQEIISRCDFLAIDEIAQTLAFIESETACKSEGVSNAGVYEALRGMVRNARCIIGADAGLNDQVIEFLESCRPGERFRIFDMADKAQGLSAAIGWGDAGMAAALGEMQTRIRDGQNIWVSCDTRRMAEAVAAWMRQTTDRPILCITKAKTAERELFLADAATVSREYAAVVHSPAISSGISIEHDHFSHGFLLFSGATIAPADASQMLRRCRQLRTWTLALSANKRRGMTDPDAMLLAMEAAAQMGGNAKRATGFDAFIAAIRAEQEQARADGSAGLLWQLENERFKISRISDAPDMEAMEGCKLARRELREAERLAILSAPDLSDADAMALRRKSAQTAEEEAALLRYQVAQGLGIKSVDADALDVWETIGPKSLDRFASALMGYTGRDDEEAEHLSQRAPHKARAAAYARLFAGIDLQPGIEITDTLAATLMDRIETDRFALAWLGMVSASWGTILIDKAGAVLPFKRPAYPRREAGELFRRLGMTIRSRKSNSGYFYYLPADFDVLREWSSRRIKQGRWPLYSKEIQAIYPVFGASKDDAFWLGIRHFILADLGRFNRERAASLVLTHLKSQGRTHGGRVTVFWLKHVMADRLAA